MDFIVSARKYRPDSFETVVGQSSISSTLKNSIRNKQIAQAYLFCGPRGVGKTTCARIFAKTINCSNLKDNVEACNECESCITFKKNQSFNIHELDAASNNSVDDIRYLIEQVRIPPQTGKYSVFIIDEVHMLSQSAFNAFLKTLEEPPAHIVFILATTEKHKIIPTILSRCQIYDFNRIGMEDITGYLAEIADKEGVKCEKDALNIIAQKADGAMRDALSIFDQLASFSDNEITYQKVIDHLNVLDYEYYFNLTDAFLNENITSALLTFDEILKKGYDDRSFIYGLSKHFRDLLISKDKETVQLLEAGESIKEKYFKQTQKVSPVFIFRALEICNNCDLGYKTSKNQRLHIELALINLCNINSEKKNDIEEQIVNESESEKVNESERKSESVSENVNESEEVISTKKEPQEKRQEKPKGKHEHIRKSEDVETEMLTISIKEALKNAGSLNPGKGVQQIDKENELFETEETERETGSYNEEILLEKWNSYAEKLKHQLPRLYSTLKNIRPAMKDNFQIELVLNNKLQSDYLKENIKSDLEQFLQDELRNKKIRLNLLVNTNEENGKKIYTSEEKFKYLKEKNPLLDTLKQEFNLDFD